jgi:hypothetical protein
VKSCVLSALCDAKRIQLDLRTGFLQGVPDQFGHLGHAYLLSGNARLAAEGLQPANCIFQVPVNIGQDVVHVILRASVGLIIAQRGGKVNDGLTTGGFDKSGF